MASMASDTRLAAVARSCECLQRFPGFRTFFGCREVFICATLTVGFQQGGGADRRSDIARLVKAGLGYSVDPKICEELLELQTKLQARQLELARLLLTKEIDREKYISELSKAMKMASTIGEKLLGFEAFHKVFGEFRVQNLGDVTRFVSGHSQLDKSY